MADISQITTLNGTTYDLKDKVARQQIPFGTVDSTSTSTAFTATVPGITSLEDGTCVMLRNSVVTSASGFTININSLGAKPAYSNMATGNPTTPTNPTRETTLFNIDYTMLFVYSTTLVDGGCWILYRGYNSNDNTIGYQLRTNSTVMKTADASRYYRIFFTSADGTHWVPANTAKDNSATSTKTVNQRPINPFGRIIYYSYTTNLSAEADVAAKYCWEQYAFALGYSFNTTGSELTLTTKTPVYIKCAPQSDGSAIIDSTTPYVQELPSSADGKIYIFLGIAYSETNVELIPEHPVYWHDGNGIRLWNGNSHKLNADVPANAVFTDTTYSLATPAAPGLMSAADKNKLDSIITSNANSPIIMIETSAFSSLPVTIASDKITANHYLLESTLSNPAAQTGAWTVTTSNGSLTISGTISGTTSAVLLLGRVDAESATMLVLDISSFSSLPVTVTDSRITAYHYVLHTEVGNPQAQISDWTVTTGSGTMSVTGSISGSSTLRVILGTAGSL